MLTGNRISQRAMPDASKRHVFFENSLLAALSFILLSLALRWITFGNNVLEVDEQYYLLVGSRMLDGALPYVDLWDRKPIGIFLLYAAFSLFGDGVLAYQLAAAAFAAATAWVIWRMARLVASSEGAWWAGVAYLVYLSAFHCFGGQTPVFYNLPAAVAALLMCRIILSKQQDRLVLHGAGVMILMGLAIQIKYTVAFEGVAFGLALLWRCRSAGWNWRQTATAGAVWVLCGLLPTLAALLFYAVNGHLQDFIYANFLSIFYRQFTGMNFAFHAAKSMAAVGAFWLAIMAAGMTSKPRLEVTRFLQLWAGAAVLGFLIMGPWFDHYRAPLLLPLGVLAAPALGRRGLVALACTALLIGGGTVVAIHRTAAQEAQRGTAAQVQFATAQIRSQLGGGCLFLMEGDTALYRTTNACFVTRFAFPGHLRSATEAQAIGANQVAELRRIMAQRPSVIVANMAAVDRAPDVEAVFQGHLARYYRHQSQFQMGNWTYSIYVKAR